MKRAIKTLAPGEVFMYANRPYMKITGEYGDCEYNVVNLSNGEMTCFEPNIIVHLIHNMYREQN